jgi:hydroxypyruvate isomerase
MIRRQLLFSSLSAAMAAQGRTLAQASPAGAKLKHSVCRATFAKVPLDEFCEACKSIGIQSIELLEPEDYPVVLKHGLECAVGRFTSKKLPASHINCGWNRPEYHPTLIEGYRELIQKSADAGVKKVICFSGLRQGMDEKTGIENCAAGLSKLMPLCDKLGVTMVMELLNSKVNHAD